jgi:cobalt-zinc-cadmium efflux system outer membrane protein
MIRASYLLVVGILSGCASTSPAPAFHDTAKLVVDRTGRRIFWNQGGADDAAVGQKVRDLVARPLTVDSSVQIALLNNKDLQAVYEELSIGQADLVQAGLLQNPVFGGGVSLPVSGQGALAHEVSTGFDVSVMQDFLSVFLLSARRKVAGAQLEATKRRVGDAVTRMTFEVESGYYALQAAQQILAMRRTIVDAGDAALDLATRQNEAGNLSDLDLATERALYEQVRTDVKRSAVDVLVAREALTRLMGLWGADTTFTVPGKLPDPPAHESPLEHLESLAVGRRLDLAAAREETQALSHALAMTKNHRFINSTSLGAGFERSPEGYSVVRPAAAVELPLFDQKQAAVARLEALVRQAQAHESALAVDIRSAVRTARGRMLAARDLVDHYANVVVPLREQVVGLTQEQYSAMLLGAYQLIASKQAEVNAYREFIEALRDYWFARADLEHATGGALPTQVSAAPSQGVTR